MCYLIPSSSSSAAFAPAIPNVCSSLDYPCPLFDRLISEWFEASVRVARCVVHSEQRERERMSAVCCTTVAAAMISRGRFPAV